MKKKVYLRIVLVLCAILLLWILGALLVTLFVPSLWNAFLDVIGKNAGELQDYLTANGRLPIPFLVMMAAACLPGLCLLPTGLLIVGQISKNEIFCAKTVALLRVLTVIFYIETVVFAAYTVYFLFSPIVAYVAFFLGVVISVVRCGLEDAIAIKSENDLTI